MPRLRKLAPHEIENIVPAGVKNLMPDDPGFLKLRFTAKSLSANPEAARLFLQANGYHVRPYGTGFNFAVQKSIIGEDGAPLPPSSNAWRVLDPDKPSDIAYDLMDLLGDFGAGIIGGAGGAALGAAIGSVVPGIGTAIGGIVGAGLGQAAGEAGRQFAGSKAGIPENFDPTNIGVAGALGAAAGPVGKFIGKGVKAGVKYIGNKILPEVQDLGLSLGARVVGLVDQPGLSAVNSLSKRAATMTARITLPAANPNAVGQQLAKGELPQAISLVDIMRARLGFIQDSGFKEATQTALMRKAATENGVTARMGPALNRFMRTKLPLSIDEEKEILQAQHTLDTIMSTLNVPTTRTVLRSVKVPSKTLTSKGVSFQTTDVVEEAVELSQKERFKILANTEYPIEVVQEVLEATDNYVAHRGGFDAIRGRKVDEFTKRARGAARALRLRIRGKLGQEYTDLNAITSSKTRLRNIIRDQVGEGKAGAENYMLNLFKGGKNQIRRDLVDFDKLFGTDFFKYAELAAVGAGFGSGGSIRPFGVPGFRPNLTATGNFLGTNLFSGQTAAAVGGFAIGGVKGALLGGLLASPRGIVTLTRAGQFGVRAGAKAVRGSARAVDVAGRIGIDRAGVAAASREIAQRIAPDKPVAREGAQERVQPRRRRLFLGGS